MLRCLFCIAVFVQSLIVQAQNSALTNAILYRNDANLIKAKEEIDKACLNEKTAQMPKTWYYKGLIYKDIFQSTYKEIQALDPEALNTSYEALRKVYVLESPPAEYAKKTDALMQEIWIVYINSGVKNYENGVYLKALNQFEHAQEIKPTDTTAYIYALYAAEKMDNDDLSMRYCERLTSIGYKSPDVYYVLIKSEFNLNRNPEKAFNISKKAIADFPNDINLLEQQTDMYVRMNRNKEALANLFILEEKKPQDVQILINIATQYDKLKEHENSIQYYTKALSIDSTNYISNYNMAVYSLKQAKGIEKRIVSNDSLQTVSNKLYKVTDYTKDPLRVELKNKLDQTNAYYSKAVIISRDASEKKNLELVLSESIRLKDVYLKVPVAQSKK